MGAPAVAPAPRRTRTKAKPRRRPAAKPRTRAASPRRKPAVRRAAGRPRAAVAGGVVMLPVAAVGGIADSGLIERMTRGRIWIVVLGLLLGGIVAINVWGLGMSASSSATEARIDALQSDNGVLQARSAKLLSTEEIQQRAAALGLAIPAPDAIHYLDANDSDAGKAAKRLAAGEIVAGDPAVEQGEVVDDPAAVTDPVATTDAATTPPATAPADPIIDPNTGLPAVDPATGAPITAVDPVTGLGVTP